jgi:hypothetical protein
MMFLIPSSNIFALPKARNIALLELSTLHAPSAFAHQKDIAKQPLLQGKPAQKFLHTHISLASGAGLALLLTRLEGRGRGLDKSMCGRRKKLPYIHCTKGETVTLSSSHSSSIWRAELCSTYKGARGAQRTLHLDLSISLPPSAHSSQRLLWGLERGIDFCVVHPLLVD